MINSLLAIFIIIAWGYIILDIFDIKNNPLNNFGLKASISTGIGLGSYSCLFFIWLFLFNTTNFFPLFISILFILTTTFWFKKKYNTFILNTSSNAQNKEKLHILIRIALFCGILFAILCFTTQILNEPHGELDAIGIWNYKARFFFRAENWTDLFNVNVAHKDYPLLIPSLISGIYTLIGKESIFVSIFVAATFTFSIPTLIYSSINIIKNNINASLVTLFFLMIPSYIERGAQQLADVPLALYILSTVVLLAQNKKFLSERSNLILAGLTSGFALWTKNEGLLFLLVLILVFSYRNWIKKITKLKYFIIGIAPILFVYLSFKIGFPFKNDLFSRIELSKAIAQILDIERHKLISYRFSRLIKDILQVAWPFLPILFLITTKKCIKLNQLKKNIKFFLVPSITLLGYYCIYLISYVDLNWHLQTSLYRLFIQIIPSFLFAIGISIDSDNIKEYFLTKKRTD